MQNWRVNKKRETNLKYFFHTCKILFILCTFIYLNSLLSCDFWKVVKCTFVEMSCFASVLPPELFFHRWINYVLFAHFLFLSFLPSNCRAFSHFFFLFSFLTWFLMVCSLVSFFPHLPTGLTLLLRKAEAYQFECQQLFPKKWTLLTDLNSPLRSVMYLNYFFRKLEISTLF